MENWKAELEEAQPDLLFVESAWRGHNNSWWNAVQRCGPELHAIVDWCKRRDIPAVFWNKEDPVHFSTFLDTASVFDVVFTTDVDCVPRYRAALGHDKVFFLPFAAQPLYHNPLEEFTRFKGCSFAGAYYQKYADRNRDFAELVPVLREYGKFDIYDRNFGTTNEAQWFPEEFRGNVVGHLLPEDIGVAYKGYTYSLNLNSVKQSQSMFARRVFELLASNTGVISNYSRGLNLLFGDLTVATDGAQRLRERLTEIEQTPNGTDRLRQLGVRKVFREHTYRHRLKEILHRAGVTSPRADDDAVLLIGFVDELAQALNVTESVHKQTHDNIDLLLISRASEVLSSASQWSYVASDVEEAKTMMRNRSFQYIGFIDPHSWYGPEYVRDMLDVFTWAKVSRVGHAERYRWSGEEMVRENQGTSWTIQPQVPFKFSLMAADADEFLAKHQLDPALKTHALSVSTLELCEGGCSAPDSALEHVTTPVIDQGASLTDFQLYARNLDPSKEVFPAPPHNLLQPATILGDHGEGSEVMYQANALGELEIESTLPEDKHEYVYNDQLLTPFMLPESQGDEVYLGFTPGLDVMLALLYFDENNQRVGHTILFTGRNNALVWPKNTVKVRAGLRVRGPGTTTLRFYSKPPVESSVPVINMLGDHGEGSEVMYQANALGELEIESTLPEDKHEYVYNDQLLTPFMLPESQGDEVYLGFTPGLDVMLALLYFDENNQRVGHTTLFTGRNNPLVWPENTVKVRAGLRVRGPGTTTLKLYSRSRRNSVAHPPVLTNRSLLVTNNYPSYDSLYKNAFIASRLRRYQSENFVSEVFCLDDNSFELSYREYEGTEVLTGNKEVLTRVATSGQLDRVLIHFLNEEVWGAFKDAPISEGVTVWIHGFEAQPWWRRKIVFDTPQKRERAIAESKRRMSFWREVLENIPLKWHFVFVSDWLAQTFFEDVGISLPREQYSVIHNIVDTNRFSFNEKPVEQRFRVLSIRPYASKIYANDLSVAAVLELQRTSPNFDAFDFHFYGDGPLFEETMEPLRDIPNVEIHQRFLTQAEISEVHKDFGVFLVPSRMDTQGVSRGEAMASGLVPITTNVAAIPEFVDAESGIVVPAEDPVALAEAMQNVADDPDLFATLSRGAASRVHNQLTFEQTIHKELELIQRSTTPGSIHSRMDDETPMYYRLLRELNR
ncbi:hypothetical protein B841_09530 [Corynebacterium maris DSM 45190]|uniref:Spore protein YkvP/CgeB glycosyl transferase-like domain-containing protein n=2 Tax=Corynebacterium TaxID=1716 RepID=S5SVY1_9CORY|nr:hypothetical protein B841_09530 [Corynebacterium maris DSM 45190]